MPDTSSNWPAYATGDVMPMETPGERFLKFVTGTVGARHGMPGMRSQADVWKEYHDMQEYLDKKAQEDVAGQTSKAELAEGYPAVAAKDVLERSNADINQMMAVQRQRYGREAEDIGRRAGITPNMPYEEAQRRYKMFGGEGEYPSETQAAPDLSALPANLRPPTSMQDLIGQEVEAGQRLPETQIKRPMNIPGAMDTRGFGTGWPAVFRMRLTQNGGDWDEAIKFIEDASRKSGQNAKNDPMMLAYFRAESSQAIREQAQADAQLRTDKRNLYLAQRKGGRTQDIQFLKDQVEQDQKRLDAAGERFSKLKKYVPGLSEAEEEGTQAGSNVVVPPPQNMFPPMGGMGSISVPEERAHEFNKLVDQYGTDEQGVRRALQKMGLIQ